MDTTIARLIDNAAQAAGLNDYQLSAAIGLLPGNRVISPKQVARMRRGEQKHYDQELLRRLAQVLPTLDEDELWLAALESANLRPDGLTIEGLRRIRHLADVGASDGYGAVTAPRLRLVPADQSVVVPFRRDRRRHPRPEIGEVAA